MEGLSTVAWFLIGVGFMLLEFIIPGFIIFFFGAGAWIAALITALGISDLNVQLLVFLISSILLLVFLRRSVKRYFEGKVSKKDISDDLIESVKGEKAVVVSDISPNKIGGKVEFHGTHWNAEADEEIKKGEVVEILERKNLVLKVRKIS
jgi:membrane protein implicated in regulation of membrane protease activity